jgi:hypothetical protein
MYPSNVYKAIGIPKKKDNTVHIQIGNSADPSNEHFEMLEMLKPYASDNIRIYAPLSYGDLEYARRVAEAGMSYFGNKFVPMLDYMSFDKYLQFLGDVDIAIFNHRRQQAMGNTITLLGLGKKVFMRNDVTPWKLFKSIGVELNCVSELNIIPMEEGVGLQNMEVIKSYFSNEKLVDQYHKIFC